jgi:PilZ domain-containing protein
VKGPDIYEPRRRVPRQEAGRPGRYLLQGDPQTARRACQVLDISLLGARLEVFEPAGNELIGREVTVEVQRASALTGTLKTSRLVGVIRDVSPGPEGGVRVGIQFMGDLPWAERAVLEAYERMQMFW